VSETRRQLVDELLSDTVEERASMHSTLLADAGVRLDGSGGSSSLVSRRDSRCFAVHCARLLVFWARLGLEVSLLLLLALTGRW
jgi:hypothetical protein